MCTDSVKQNRLRNFETSLRHIHGFAQEFGRAGTLYGRLVHNHLPHIIQTRQLEHRVLQRTFDNRTQTACAGPLLDSDISNRPNGLFCELQIDAVDGEQFTVLLDQRVGWLGENRRQIVYGKFLQHTGDRQTSDETQATVRTRPDHRH